MLVVEESEICNTNLLLNILKNNSIPVIILSTDLFLKDVPLRIEKLSVENMLKAIAPILKKESCTFDNKLLIKLWAHCDCDLRKTLNYLQILRLQKDPTKAILKIDQISSCNAFQACNKLFSKGLFIETLESMYEPKISTMALSSALASSKASPHVFSALEALSLADCLPKEYEFLSLVPLNNIRDSFTYIKEEPLSYSTNLQNPIHFLSSYKRDLSNKQSTLHLKAIFEKYHIKDLNEIDMQIQRYVEFSPIEVKKMLKYRFKTGHAAAVLRDVSLREIYDSNS